MKKGTIPTMIKKITLYSKGTDPPGNSHHQSVVSSETEIIKKAYF